MKYKFLYALGLVSALSYSCSHSLEKDTYRVILEDQDNLAEKAKLAKEKLPIKIAPGLQITRFASDSLAPDPVSMDMDDQGAVYITRTNRGKYSEFDIRGHRDWMTESIGFQSVADRKAFLHKTFAPENSSKNEWLPDLNQDGIHDVNDLKVEKEEIWKIEDKNGDGLADQATRVYNGFHEEFTDVAGGILVRKKDAFIAVGPDLWRLKNTKKNGLLTEPVSISTGYAVHIGFGGHGMSGVIEGPDGKIYWQIGDIGANITALDGKQYKYPNSGVIVRSNPDGSNFEVFASGLRNTHEFVFDQYGNLISSDNDGDHPGESERLVHIVEGSDAGWRSNWQYGKYTDPGNNLYKVWMDEKLYVPRWKGQAAYIIPPIRNYHNGPTGMLFNPGTALGKKWTNKFFLVEFVGNPNASHIWSFDLKPKGASFDFKSEEDVVSGILPTGMRFGPDGALYAADWVNGWDVKHYGRVWKIDVDAKNNDLEQERAETKRLIQLDYEKQNANSLYDLLFYTDLRVRMKAQFELAKRGNGSVALFQQAIQQKDNQLARIHAIWGMGQLGATDAKVGAMIGEQLQDQDEEIVAQAAKVLGDIFNKDHEGRLIQLIDSKNPRISFFACQALGRIKSENAIPGLLKLIEKNNDEDHYIRHAAVLALARIGKEEPLVALASSSNTALKTAAVLVLRRLSSPKVALFLQDSDEYIATEAARAINDDESIPAALPALAAALNNKAWKGEPLLRRAINASLRVGTNKEIDALIQFSERNDISDVIRAEAIATLGSWANPSVLDRVDGRHRGVLQRNPADVVGRIYPKIANFLRSNNPEVLVATAKLLSELKITDFKSEQTQLFLNHANAKVRAAHLGSLVALKDAHLSLIVQKGMNDVDRSVRGAALGFLDKVDMSKTQLPSVVNLIMEKGSVIEQQQLLQSIGKMPVDKTDDVLDDLIQRMIGNKLSNDIRLDLMEAVEATNSQKLIAKLDALKTKGTLTDEFKDALFGGSIQAGNFIFNRNQTVQCVRCHNVGGEGGIVGPSLKGIGSRLSREQILQALIEPSARIAPGYGTISLKLTDGQEVSGTVISETESMIQLKTSDAEPLKIAISRIKSRENYPSSMPPMGSLMSKREIRDVVEFLSSLRN
ncbi:HEAT repeat domain-containing protein [Aquirufa ecclesiirivi]|uniref:HEAT repeat domain-containing protein n=1 Tax=Aquirufa ecclesiirivi TaxID=2715124 RepID=UPI0023D81A29|nr:HEAT repeat domain-containing protein [Aquirufa ecclesiirivi]MDF0693684.1 HEAT repeat domain-containing protein [Aquirufa ecclesiirivi]